MLGFININKDKGVSSGFVVNKIKHFFKCKCGHMGTLDPLASGVLPIGLGQATRLFDTLLQKNKKYIAEFDFAYSTPSFDLETSPDNYSSFVPTKFELEKSVKKFVGDIKQVPPIYSAICVDGTRSYKLARSGQAIELPAKDVTINSIKVLEQITESKFKLEIDCSSGTYIRSIVRDIASDLGVYGTMTSLIRAKSGYFSLENSVTLEQLFTSTSPEKCIIKPDLVLTYDSIVLNEENAKKLINGLNCYVENVDGVYKVYNGEEFWGVGNVNNRILKMSAFVRDL